MARKLTLATLTTLTALSLTGCWNGIPFQVDFQGKAVVDYPEGDPRRAGGIKTVTPSANPDSGITPENPDNLYELFPDYDIPRGKVNVTTSTVLQPRGQYPARVDMARDLWNVTPVAPTTTYLHTVVGVFDPRNMIKFGPENIYEAGGTDRARAINSGADAQVREVLVSILAFDGSYEKTYPSDTYSVLVTDGAPSYTPLFIKAEINGRVGLSKPFILAPSEYDIDRRYIPVRMDVAIAR